MEIISLYTIFIINKNDNQLLYVITWELNICNTIFTITNKYSVLAPPLIATMSGKKTTDWEFFGPNKFSKGPPPI